MIRHVLSNRLLLVHRTVVEAGTLTAAAESLGFTVSAVSQQLATLEAQAGTKLFERVGRGVRPTAAGRLLAARADRSERLAT
jgi:DNA-binding transcriptional LysR family regulator